MQGLVECCRALAMSAGAGTYGASTHRACMCLGSLHPHGTSLDSDEKLEHAPVQVHACNCALER